MVSRSGPPTRCNSVIQPHEPGTSKHRCTRPVSDSSSHQLQGFPPMDLLLPRNIVRLVPDWFSASLNDSDPNLIVYFNEYKNRWIIDRCTRDGVMASVAQPHDATCPRTNVIVVHDEGKYMPLCDAVIDQIRAMDTWSTDGSLEKYKARNAAMEAAYQAKTDTEQRNLYIEAGLDNKRQLNQMLDLISIHDVARPHK